ncbi:hypothetical protein BDV97DRAFT_353686 [Delphinella strobiligena]|nr:hypothetical protein BDV97DRAFT_353686 [Delphinella strobiligena]
MFRNVPKGNASTSTSSPSSNYRGGNRFRGRGGNRGGSRGRGGGSNNRRQQDPTKRGLFADGIWLCNCTPRLPAEHFKVKKEGPNKGRYFYTCQNSEGRRCDFFLWDEDAKPREEAAVLSGKRDEPRATQGVFDNAQTYNGRGESIVEETRYGQQPRQQFGHGVSASQMSTQSQDLPPPYSRQDESPQTLGRSTFDSNASNKRSLSDTGFEFDDNDADAFDWDLSGQEAAELARMADRASLAPETPRKAVKTTAYATPVTTGDRKLPWLEQAKEAAAQYTDSAPQTPSKSVGKAAIPTPNTTKATTAMTIAPDTTPTPSRFRDALSESNASSLVDDVFTLLNSSSTSLNPDVSTELWTLLNNHDRKSQGISKGREMVRLALKARDIKVVELGARIASLEAEREVYRAKIRGLRLKDGKII